MILPRLWPASIFGAVAALLLARPAQAQFTISGGAQPSTPAASTFDSARNTNTHFSFSTDKLTATTPAAAPVNSNYSAFTTGFHSDVKRYFEFNITIAGAGCVQGLGVAASNEINEAYLGHAGSLSIGIFSDGSTSLGAAPLGNTGITFATGDTVVFIIDPVGKTIQEVKNGGSPSAPISIAGLTTQNVSPAVALCAAGDSMTFSGNPPGVTYAGARAWDAP